jgi:hypothetical protein
MLPESQEIALVVKASVTEKRQAEAPRLQCEVKPSYQRIAEH